MSTNTLQGKLYRHKATRLLVFRQLLPLIKTEAAIVCGAQLLRFDVDKARNM